MSSRLEKILVALLLQVTVAGGFFLAERYVATHAMPPPPWLVTRLDVSLPLVPATIWLYVSWYPAPLGILFTERHKFRHAALAMFTAFTICMIGYLLVPISISRPALDDTSGLTEALLQAVYAMDAPVNLFPSFHAAAAIIVLLTFFDVAALRRPLLLWVLGIAASCVLTKQHYVFDVVAGLCVGWLSYGLAPGVSWAPAAPDVMTHTAATS